jgi:hypothetical protein
VLRDEVHNPRSGGGGNPMAMAPLGVAFYLFALGSWEKLKGEKWRRECEGERRHSIIRGSGLGGEMIFRGSYRLGESETWGAQQEEEFAGPEQNVQQTAALQIAQVLRL